MPESDPASPENSPPKKALSRRSILGGAGISIAAAVAASSSGVTIAAKPSGGDADGGPRRGPDDGPRPRPDQRRDRGRGPDDRPVPGLDPENRDTPPPPRGDDLGLDRFSRMFNEPVYAEPSEELTEALVELGRLGGIMDAKDPLEVGPTRLITEPDLSPNNPDNPNHTAGTTFVGQFLDHDITRDAGSRLNQPTSLGRSVNLRSARFDLDSVYGGGPTQMPGLYEADDPFRLRVESGGKFEDLPRDTNGNAIIGDDRNDENVMVSGLQAAFLMFHNAVLDRVRATGSSDEESYREAVRQVRWHYQWLIVHEWLPQFVGQEMVDEVLTNGRQFYTDQTPRIPVEFQAAAYRFGHSMVRPSYRANMAGDNGEPFFGFVFDPETYGDADPDDLAGGHRAPRRYVGWQTFFDFEDGEVKPNKRIDTKISTPLFQLPIFTLPNNRGEPVGPTSLPTRNLLRHTTWELPSGQQLASAMSLPRLSPGDLDDLSSLGANLATSTPLWFYILREAEVIADGLHLGPVGGRIVAEVFVGLLQLDDESYLNAQPDWTPTLPTANTDVGFRTTDLLTIAGVDPASRGE